jgi:5,6-dimethylbenzimidazole synthase
MSDGSRPPRFDASFRERFAELVRWRRDVRRFRPDPVPAELIERLLSLATYAPSVGFSQPWRFVLVESPERRTAISADFERANRAALDGYDGERRAAYARLKLAGLSRAPVHLAVCADEATVTGHGLGRQTMPETLRYSVVAAVQT